MTLTTRIPGGFYMLLHAQQTYEALNKKNGTGIMTDPAIHIQLNQHCISVLILYAYTKAAPPTMHEINDQKQPADIPSTKGSVSRRRLRKNLVLPYKRRNHAYTYF